MSNLLRFGKPSWWAYHWQRRNVLKFWWNHLNTKGFPADCASLERLVEFGRHYRIRGFNRECIRSYIFWRLFKNYDCTSFVETGSLYGETTSYVNRVFKTPIFTCEINKTYHIISKINLLWTRDIYKYLGDSPEFLDQVLQPSLLGNNPMFYLDAHWRGHVPLGDELTLIAERCEKALILVDDFKVPWNSDFLFDEYPSMTIDMDVLSSYLLNQRKDATVYLPDYGVDQEPTGKGIGFAVVLMGQERDLPSQSFPFNLLGQVVD